MRRILIFILCFLSSCQEANFSDFREEGTRLIEKGAEILQTIKTRDDLYRHEQEIKENFISIFILLHKAEHYRVAHPEEEIPYFTLRSQKASDHLLKEINRILAMPGGEEALLRIQNEAMQSISRDVFL